nr:hypothetical protein [Tanacetum cinerariifolium]
MAQPDNNTQLSSAFKTFFERETLTGPCPNQPLETAYEEDEAAWKAEYKKHNDDVEIYDLVDALHSCKQAPGKSVSAHVWEMKGYIDQLHALGKCYDNDMAINLINRSLKKDFGDFVRNFNMHCVGKTVTELHALLIDYEKGLKDKAPTPQVLTIQNGRENKPKPKANKKDKSKGKTDKNKKVVPYQPKP